jgi:hypothetical protein
MASFVSIVRRDGLDGSIDSIRTNCNKIIATWPKVKDLAAAEANHICDSKQKYVHVSATLHLAISPPW